MKGIMNRLTRLLGQRIKDRGTFISTSFTTHPVSEREIYFFAILRTCAFLLDARYAVKRRVKVPPLILNHLIVHQSRKMYPRSIESSPINERNIATLFTSTSFAMYPRGKFVPWRFSGHAFSSLR